MMIGIIEIIPSPTLVSFAGSGVAEFFMGMFLCRVLKLLVIIVGSFLRAVFLVIQWMQAHHYIQGQVDWSRVGNDTYSDVDISRAGRSHISTATFATN